MEFMWRGTEYRLNQQLIFQPKRCAQPCIRKIAGELPRSSRLHLIETIPAGSNGMDGLRQEAVVKIEVERY